MSSLKLPSQLTEYLGNVLPENTFPNADLVNTDIPKYLTIENNEYKLRDIPIELEAPRAGILKYYACNSTGMQATTDLDSFNNDENGIRGFTTNISDEYIIKRVQFTENIENGDLLSFEMSYDRKTWFNMGNQGPIINPKVGGYYLINVQSDAKFGVRLDRVDSKHIDVMFYQYMNNNNSNWSAMVEWYWRIVLTKFALSESLSNQLTDIKQLKNVVHEDIDKSVLVYNKDLDKYESKILDEHKLPEGSSSGFIKYNSGTKKYSIESGVDIAKVNLVYNNYNNNYRNCVIRNQDYAGLTYMDYSSNNEKNGRRFWCDFGDHSNSPEGEFFESAPSSTMLFDREEIYTTYYSGDPRYLNLTEPKKITSYKIKNPTTYYRPGIPSPSSFNIYGTNDVNKVKWNLLDSQTNLTWTGLGQELTFNIDPENQAEYRYYKFEWNGTGYGISAINPKGYLSKIFLFAGDVDVSAWKKRRKRPIMVSFSDGFDENGPVEDVTFLDDIEKYSHLKFFDLNIDYAQNNVILEKDIETGELSFKDCQVGMNFGESNSWKSEIDNISYDKNVISSEYSGEGGRGIRSGFYNSTSTSYWTRYTSPNAYYGLKGLKCKIHRFSLMNTNTAANNATSYTVEYSINEGKTWNLINTYTAVNTVNIVQYFDLPDYDLTQADREKGYWLRVKPPATLSTWGFKQFQFHPFYDYFFDTEGYICKKRDQFTNVITRCKAVKWFLNLNTANGYYIKPGADWSVQNYSVFEDQSKIICSTSDTNYLPINAFTDSIGNNTTGQWQTSQTMNTAKDAVFIGLKDIANYNKVECLSYYGYTAANMPLNPKIQYCLDYKDNGINTYRVTPWLTVTNANVLASSMQGAVATYGGWRIFQPNIDIQGWNSAPKSTSVGEYVGYDFGTTEYLFTSYTMYGRYMANRRNNPIHWKFQGSVDGTTWEDLDEYKIEDKHEFMPGEAITRPIKYTEKKYYSKFRIINMADLPDTFNISSDQVIMIGKLNVYGVTRAEDEAATHVNIWHEVPLKNYKYDNNKDGTLTVNTAFQTTTYHDLYFEDYDISEAKNGKYAIRLIPETNTGSKLTITRMCFSARKPYYASYAYAGNSSKVYESAWTAVEINKRYTFSHLLGTSDYDVSIYWNDRPTDTGCRIVNNSYPGYGAAIIKNHIIIAVCTGATGVYSCASYAADNLTAANYTTGYYKVVAKRNF